PDYSPESFVLERVRTTYRFENDGTGRREIYARIKVQSEAGVQQWGQVGVGDNSPNERIEIPYVRVHKSDGISIRSLAELYPTTTCPHCCTPASLCTLMRA